ncbi:protein of unknown function DUF1275 [Gordonia bronchialis DSM 43247]|uniref:DUF1275 domain-containing protein n=1 Tax=Gordonia bronchialis (strain ATCC 25592 / DSM 43247 / BCRC 13721 / JCM 3198 / KCTC 3076 / NBRC 16047 / NCTC 10667) TaxID=526226 RepID=D0LCE1_GORB4|nr:protein of unknown function DUF1275 [Gordonia bronchialis DSM 43247]STQ62431.1 Predicted membrane protein [Gordonia bronchialis]
MLSRFHAAPAERLHAVLMIALTFTTGINDAVGYLGLDKVFTGNMTGNVVILGMGVAGGDGLPVLGPALALAGFMAGAGVAGLVLRPATRGWSARTTVLLACVAAVMVASAAILFTVGDSPTRGWMITVTTSAATAMGVQAATARVVAVKDVSTVVVTSTITGLAADVFGPGPGLGRDAARRFAAIAAILVGAAVGVLLMNVHLGVGLLVAGVIIAVVTVVGALHRPSCQTPSLQ